VAGAEGVHVKIDPRLPVGPQAVPVSVDLWDVLMPTPPDVRRTPASPENLSPIHASHGRRDALVQPEEVRRIVADPHQESPRA
jgi:hypothetical protein